MKNFVAYGPGFSGLYETRREAEEIIRQHGKGAIYERIPRTGFCRHRTEAGYWCNLCERTAEPENLE